MKEQEWEFAKQLNDDELIATLTRCVKEERDVTARLLVHLGEVDARGLFRDLGFSSMFLYAVQALHMSESEAWLRIRAARLGREFPTALAMVARGELHMTALKLLAPVLTPSNLELLDQARFKSKLEIQKLLAAHFPQPDAPSVIRRLPSLRSGAASASRAATTASGAGTTTLQPAQGAGTSSGAGTQSVELASSATHLGGAAKSSDAEQGTLGVVEAPHPSDDSMPSAMAPADCGALPAASAADPVRPHAAASGSPSLRAQAASSIVPLSPGRYKVQFTATQSLVDLFDEARDLLQNQTLNADLSSIVERALALLIAERKKQRFAQTNKPRTQRLSESDATADEACPTIGPSTRGVRVEPEASTRIVRVEPEASTRIVRVKPVASKPNTRHIPHALRRQVYARDAGRCCFVSPEGTRCRARGRLEFHHIVPFARGGEATVDNICLMCRAHNALVAERDYGREYVKRRMAERRAAPRGRLARRRRVS